MAPPAPNTGVVNYFHDHSAAASCVPFDKFVAGSTNGVILQETVREVKKGEVWAGNCGDMTLIYVSLN